MKFRSVIITCIAALGLVAGCSGDDGDIAKKCTDCGTADAGVADAGNGADGGEAPDATVAPGCADGQQNGDETDVDCGGACGPCEAGLTCMTAADCGSGVCDGTCQAESCSDGVRNGDEADVDCGGSACERCAEGATCDNQCDCQSAACVEGTCRHSLVGSWAGSPDGSASVRITMDFTEERVEWFQSFNNGQMDCFHRGAGDVSNLMEDSFDMTDYAKIDNSCSLGMFLRGDYAVGFQFTDSERIGVRVSPAGSETYRLRRVVEEDLECAKPAGPPPIAGEGGFGDLEPYPTYEELFDAFFIDAIDPTAAAGFAVSMEGEPTVYTCPAGGTLTVAHEIQMPVESITRDITDLVFEACALPVTVSGAAHDVVLDGTLTRTLTNRGIGPEYDVEASITATGDLDFAVECDLYQDSGSCTFSDEIGNVIEGAGGVRPARRVPTYRN